LQSKQELRKCRGLFDASYEAGSALPPSSGSARHELRGDTCAENVFALMDEAGAAMEPERLWHISLGKSAAVSRESSFGAAVPSSGLAAVTTIIINKPSVSTIK